MKTVVILGADSLGMAVAQMLNPQEMKLIGLGDTRPDTWNVFSDPQKGELKEKIDGMPVMPVDLAVGFQPDMIVIATTDAEKATRWNTWLSGPDFSMTLYLSKIFMNSFPSAAASFAVSAADLTV